MKAPILINENTYRAIMLDALRAARRETWLVEASDMVEAGIAPDAYSAIEAFFAPFGERIAKAANREGDADAKTLFFREFVHLYVG